MYKLEIQCSDEVKKSSDTDKNGALFGNKVQPSFQEARTLHKR